MAQAQLVGLKELRRELRKLDNPRSWTRELATVHREVARDVAGWARSEAASLGGPARHFADAVRGYGSAPAARVGLSSAGKGQRNYGARGAFWGSKQFARFEPWVGNTYEVGVRGEGPYALNDAIADHLDDVIETYSEGIDRLMRRAFPD